MRRAGSESRLTNRRSEGAQERRNIRACLAVRIQVGILSGQQKPTLSGFCIGKFHEESR